MPPNHDISIRARVISFLAAMLAPDLSTLETITRAIAHDPKRGPGMPSRRIRRDADWSKKGKDRVNVSG